MTSDDVRTRDSALDRYRSTVTINQSHLLPIVLVFSMCQGFFPYLLLAQPYAYKSSDFVH